MRQKIFLVAVIVIATLFAITGRMLGWGTVEPDFRPLPADLPPASAFTKIHSQNYDCDKMTVREVVSDDQKTVWRQLYWRDRQIPFMVQRQFGPNTEYWVDATIKGKLYEYFPDEGSLGDRYRSACKIIDDFKSVHFRNKEKSRRMAWLRNDEMRRMPQ